jgi:hypothetical protein
MLKHRRVHRDGESGRLSAIAAALAAAALCGCSGDHSGDPRSVPEETAAVSQAFLGAGCNNSDPTQTNCWWSYSGPNYTTFDISQGFTCAVQTLAPQAIDCYVPSAGTQSMRLGWYSNNGTLPAPVKSIALAHPDYGSYGPYNTYTMVAMLTDETVSKVWFSDGDASASYYSAGGSGSSFYTNFGTVYPNYQALIDNHNNPICLSKIVYVNMPTGSGGPRTDLIGLSCPSDQNPNQIYFLSGGVWLLGSTSGIEPWSMLSPQMQFSDISHGNALHVQTGQSSQGAYLLTTDGSVILIGNGYTPWGQVTFYPPTTLPPLSIPGFPGAMPIAVGGPFVITNAGNSCPTANSPCIGDDYRFYRYYDGAWTPVSMSSGTSYLVETAGEPQPFLHIVDGSSFLGRASAFSVFQHFYRYNMFTGVCSNVQGPALTGNLSGWSNSGLVLHALQDGTLQSFVFNNQGQADTVRLFDATLGFQVASTATNPGNTALTVTVDWPLLNGHVYHLTSDLGNNGRWVSFTTWPQTNPEISVDATWGNGATRSSWWFTFTNLVTSD